MSNQLVKRDYSEGYRKVFPKTFIDAIKDRDSGMSLAEILQGFNMYFLSYNGNKALTRCSVPHSLRKEGLWITYVLYDHTVITEWYNSDNIDDEAFGSDDNWRQASNMLVGDISVSADGYWIIEGKKTSTKAQGEIGITPLLRFGDNNKLQASYNEGIEWEDISGDITNNLKISKYIGINEALPTSGIAEGTIYMKGPYYDENDTNNDNPIYRMWVYAWKGNTLAWQDNGEFTSISAGVVQETGNSTTQVMSQDAVTREFAKLSEEKGGIPVPILNEIIMEMYCSNEVITTANSVGITYNSAADTISLMFRKDSADLLVVNIRKENIVDSCCISPDTQGRATFVFFINESKWFKAVDLHNSVHNVVIGSDVLSAGGKPNICNSLHLHETFRNVIYEKVTSARITTDGEVVSSANANWFYTKPIAVKKNDVVSYQNAGNATTAVISYTDSLGSFYEPAPIKYTGKDPDKYTLIIDRDGYISVCGLANIVSQYLIIGSSPVISTLGGKQEKQDILVIDNLETASADKALSANQGVQLKRMIDTLSPSLQGNNYNDVPISGKIKSPEFLTKAKDEWTATNGEVGSKVSVYDEVNGDYKECRELKVEDNALFTTALEKSIDITDKAFRFAIKLGEIAEEYRRTLQIRLYSNNAIDDAHMCRIRLQAPYNSNLPKRTRYGWWCGAINAYHAGYKFGSFDASQVTHVGIYFENSQQPVSIFVNEIGFSEPTYTGGAVIVIDNYNNSVPLMADYAFEKGVKLNLSIIPNKIGVTFGPDTQATLEEINRGKMQGHLIFNHTFNHNASTEPVQTSLEEIYKAEQWMLNNGFARGSRIVSVPSSLFPEDKYMAYMKSNALSIYHNWITPPNPIEPAAEGYLIHYPYAPAARFFNISALDSNVSTSNPTPYMNYLVDAVREAVNSKGYVVLGFHGTFWQRDNGVLWKKFIDDIAAIEGAHFYGMDEVLENMIA